MTAGTRSFTCLVNPHSGGGALEAVVAVARGLRERGARVEVVHSPGLAATRELAAQAVGDGDVVVAGGGDGMVASLVGTMAGLVDRGGALGLVPAGRGNDFARMLRVPGDHDALVERLLCAAPRAVDVIDVRGPGLDEVVAGSVYAGVDAQAAAMVARMRRTPRPLQYPSAAVRSIAGYVPHRYLVSVDGETREFDAATVVVANSAYYGAGMRIAPDAVLDDGLLDVVVVEAGSRLDFLRTFPKVYSGRHVDHPKVTVLRGRAVEVTALSPRPVEVGADGEDLGVLPGPADGPLRLEVRHRGLLVL